ncbi:hypothetical protein BC833DRAFT_590353 [Globomyces pollinis-pini]|nr:hypothetical protein BC833DRAFT_590353 [Globomyces pollinis-pini]
MEKDSEKERKSLSIDSIRTNATIVVLVFLDLILSQLAMFYSLYDQHSPSVASAELNVLQTLKTDNQTHTNLRTVVFALSASLRCFFFLELITRFFFSNFKSYLYQKPFYILDSLVCIAAVPLKFALNGRDSLLCNFILVIRLGRLWSISAYINQATKRDAKRLQLQVERKCQDLLKASEAEIHAANQRYETLQAKVNALTG